MATAKCRAEASLVYYLLYYPHASVWIAEACLLLRIFSAVGHNIILQYTDPKAARYELIWAPEEDESTLKQLREDRIAYKQYIQEHLTQSNMLILSPQAFPYLENFIETMHGLDNDDEKRSLYPINLEMRVL